MNNSFRTEVEVKKYPFEISHHDRLMMVGSCFTENIGNSLLENGFCTDINPFGIVYNPLSISNSLNRLVSKTPFAENELFFHNEQWHSWAHHSRFSASDKTETLGKINNRISTSSEVLLNANVLILTLGTSWVYRLVETNEVVANCHKLPDKKFKRELLNSEAIFNDFNELFQKLYSVNPILKIILTVSPVRHLKDTAHGNQVSKSILFLAIEQLLNNPNIYYFPAFEIVMDDLRDYRFYAEDMIHPSSQAVDYIWEKFSQSFFSSETQGICHQVQKIKKNLEHRPFNPTSVVYKKMIDFSQNEKFKLLKMYPLIQV